MASIPNTRAAPSPIPAGQAQAAAAGAPGFAIQLAGIPGELLRIAAATLSGSAEPEAKAPDADGGDAKPAATDAPTDAAQLTALAPLLQPQPAAVAAQVLTPAPAPAPAITPQIPAKAAAAAVQAAPGLPTSASAPAPTAKAKSAKADAKSDQAAVQPEGEPTAAAPDKPARDIIAAAKRALDALVRPATTPAAAAQAAPKAAPAAPKPATPAPPIFGEASAPAPSVAIAAAPAVDAAAASLVALQAAPPPAPSADVTVQPRETAAAPAPDRTLDLTHDSAWLDRLAHDIAQTAGNDGTIRFRLHPQTLGHLSVELSQGDRGTSVRLTADTEQARAILADAQPRLAAEARAQGVRIAETHVDLSGSDRQASGDPRRQDDARQTPLIRTARDAAAGEDAPERPGRAGSDRYA